MRYKQFSFPYMSHRWVELIKGNNYNILVKEDGFGRGHGEREKWTDGVREGNIR